MKEEISKYMIKLKYTLLYILGSRTKVVKNLNELNEGDFFQSSNYYSKLGYAYGNVELKNKRYGVYSLVFDKQSKSLVLDNTTLKKKDLTIIRDVVTNVSYVTLNSLSKFIGVNGYNLKSYVESVDELIKFGGKQFKYIVLVSSIRNILSNIQTNWSNTQNLKPHVVDIILNFDIEDFVNSFDKNSLLIKVKPDLVSVAKYLGLPVKYHVKDDLIVHINTKLYDDYKYKNCVDVLTNLENDRQSLIGKLSHIESKVLEMESPDSIYFKRLSNILKSSIL